MEYIRHGDVLLARVNSIPAGNYETKKDRVLVEGEVTGHAHRLSGGTVLLEKEQPSSNNNFSAGYVDIETNVEKLTHEEHDTIELKKGKYKFWIQREFDPMGDRKVID